MIGKIEQFNFRELHHRYLLLLNDDQNIMVASKAFPHEEGDNALLLYGYIDHEAGISFEVLGFARQIEGQPIQYRDTSPDTALKLRYDSVKGVLGHVSTTLEFYRYKSRVDVINQHYNVHFAVEHIRTIESLDKYRSPQYPDDIIVFFVKENCKPEGIWVRLEKNIGDKLAGRILNEPWADYGYHTGDYIRIEPVVKNNELLPIAIL
ncbi:MAG: hypothetical protein IJ353_07020 [Lachnospiraceae bacterium]|nr:hypothetical protein [Lachnospiraceae bacterium]